MYGGIWDICFSFFFFFSSRRRHTRCSRDWSSDVCSSDLGPVEGGVRVPLRPLGRGMEAREVGPAPLVGPVEVDGVRAVDLGRGPALGRLRSEEHTSELQSRLHLVCRLLLEKKKKKRMTLMHAHRVHRFTPAGDAVVTYKRTATCYRLLPELARSKASLRRWTRHIALLSYLL